MRVRRHPGRLRSATEELEPRRLLSAVTFGSPTAYGSGSSLGVVAVDLNGDGHLDVVSPNSASGGSDGVSVSLNTGSGAFTAPVSYTTSNSSLNGFQPYALATGDFNGDGHADIASANYASGTLSILFGDGNGALGNTEVYAAGNTPDGIAVGDLNGDGHPDVVVANRGDNTVSVFINNGNGTFAPAVTYAVGSSPNGVAIGDLNGDGHPDIVVADDGSAQLTELLNNGDGTFTAITSNIAGNAVDVQIADMNNDGQLDIVASIGGSSPGIDVLLNAGNNVFSPTFFSTATSPIDLTIADFNDDGDLDVASADLNNQSVDVQLGNGDGTLGAVQSFSTGLDSYSIASGDLNGDNKPDLIIGSYNPGGTSAFATLLNDSSGTAVIVPGRADPFLAGQPDGAISAGDTAGDPLGSSPSGESPTPYPNGLAVTPGQVLTFVASGSAGYGDSAGDESGPAGILSYPNPHAAEDGIAGITTFIDSLTGVFLSNATPDPNADPSTLPASLDFTTGAELDYASGSFALNQPFYIGNGRTTTGVTRQITVPAGATRLFMGIMDGFGWYDNIGAFTVVVSGASGTAATTPAKSIGGLDPSFGTDGLASHDVGFTSTSGVATDGTASVLIGPIGSVGSQTFGVTRYLSDGSLDTSFGTAGVTSTAFAGLDAVPTSVNVLFGGDILVAGTATTYVNGVATGSEFAVAEYTPAGVLDTSFGIGGQMLVSFSKTSGTLSNDVLRSVAVSAGGVIYLGGSSDAAGAGNTDFAVAALTKTGSLETSFNSTGTTLIDIAGGNDQVNSLAVQTNNDVVAAGSGTVNGVAEVALARLLPTGALDKKFNRTGIVTDAVGSVYDSASSVVIQPKGQIVIGGLTASGSGSSLSSDFLVQRYTTAGKLDRTFAGGSVTTSFGQPAAVTQLALQADGSIVASGKTSATLGGTLDVAVARYTTKGALDTSFGTAGKTVVDLSSGVVAQTVSAARLIAAAASALGAEFDAFTSSLQGVVAVTEGGEILTAGNSGADTVEAELIAAGVDLVTKVLSALPASVLAGVKGKLTVTITESGTTAAKGAVTIAVSFATNADGSDASTPVSFSEKVNLKQGQSKPFKLSFTYPTGLASGAYFALASVTNGTGVPADLNAANNTAAGAAAVTIAPAFITLAGSGLSSGAIVAGKPVTISIDITNNGNVKADGKTEVDFYLSTDTTVADGTLLDKAPLGVGLPAGKSKPYHVKFTAASTIPAGTFNLLGVIDPNNNLGHGDASDALVVGAGPVMVS